MANLPEEAVVVAEIPVVDDRLFGVFTRMSGFLSRWADRFVAFYRRSRVTKEEEPISPDSARIVSDRPGGARQRVVKTAQTAKQMIRLKK